MQCHVRWKPWDIPKTLQYTLEIVLYFLGSQNKRECRENAGYQKKTDRALPSRNTVYNWLVPTLSESKAPQCLTIPKEEYRAVISFGVTFYRIMFKTFS